MYLQVSYKNLLTTILYIGIDNKSSFFKKISKKVDKISKKVLTIDFKFDKIMTTKLIKNQQKGAIR